MKTLRVMFHIIDNEFECEYDYESIFLKEAEFIGFIKENLAVGNEVSILSIEEETADLEELKNRFYDHF